MEGLEKCSSVLKAYRRAGRWAGKTSNIVIPTHVSNAVELVFVTAIVATMAMRWRYSVPGSKAIRKNDDGFWKEEENKCVEFPSVNPGEETCSVASCFYSSLGIISLLQAGMLGFLKTSPEFTLCPVAKCSFEHTVQI